MNLHSQIVLHWFLNPEKNFTRFRTWVHAIGGKILSLSNVNIYKLRRVCHAHFEEKYCCRNNRISNIAIPTLLMPGPLSLPESRKPVKENEKSLQATVQLDATVENLGIQECTLQVKYDKGILPAECKETADILLFFDNLFDSVNGSFTKNRFSKPLLGPVTPNSKHHEFRTESKKVLKSMKFITEKNTSVPTINNWVWTLEGIETLVKILAIDQNITYLWMRHLNQDPIKNFFGAIRSHGCRNTNVFVHRHEGIDDSMAHEL